MLDLLDSVAAAGIRLAFFMLLFIYFFSPVSLFSFWFSVLADIVLAAAVHAPPRLYSYSCRYTWLQCDVY